MQFSLENDWLLFLASEGQGNLVASHWGINGLLSWQRHFSSLVGMLIISRLVGSSGNGRQRLFSVRVHEQVCSFLHGIGFPCEADVDYTIPNDCVYDLYEFFCRQRGPLP